MKFETLLLKSFVAAGLAVCLLTFAAMVTATPTTPVALASHASATKLASSAS